MSHGGQTKKQLRFVHPKNTVILQPNLIMVDPLAAIGPSLYKWEDNGEFIQWLATSPESNSEATESMNFLEGIATRQNEEVNHDLATLVDNILYEDVCQLQVDGTQLDDIDILMYEDELVSPLQFKPTSSSITVGREVPLYPSIPRDWY